MSASAYPLQWPVGRKRTTGARQRNGTFKMAEGAKVGHLHDELERLGAEDVVISTNRAPYSRSDSPEDPGVAVYFKRKGKELCIACDKWDRIQDNIHAIGLAVEAIRGLERWGTGDMVDAAFSGFTALPEAIVTPAPQEWWQVLGMSGSTRDQERIKAAFRKLSLKAHPDAGGTDAEFNRLREAYEEGMNQ